MKLLFQTKLGDSDYGIIKLAKKSYYAGPIVQWPEGWKPKFPQHSHKTQKDAMERLALIKILTWS